MKGRLHGKALPCRYPDGENHQIKKTKHKFFIEETERGSRREIRAAAEGLRNRWKNQNGRA